MMKKIKLELIPLILFAVIAVLSFVAEETVAGLGWTVATMIQLRMIAKIIIEEDEQGKI